MGEGEVHYLCDAFLARVWVVVKQTSTSLAGVVVILAWRLLGVKKSSRGMLRKPGSYRCCTKPLAWRPSSFSQVYPVNIQWCWQMLLLRVSSVLSEAEPDSLTMRARRATKIILSGYPNCISACDPQVPLVERG